ncbi:MAG: hypothetical protein Q9178_006510 [Gyalolechia marmorata]
MHIRTSKRRKLNQPSLDNDYHNKSTSTEPLPVNQKGNTRRSDPSISRPSHYGTTTSLDGSARADLFKLQLDELLGRIRPKYETKLAKADSEVHRLRGIIEGIPNQKGLPAPEAQKFLEESQSVCVPFPELFPVGSKLLLAYSKPTNINVVGSYARKTSVLLCSTITIDMAVTMPSDLFQASDYRDYRYFHKRAYYVACIASAIKRARVPTLDLSFAYQNDNPLQPIIVAQPSPDKGDNGRSRSSWRIRILLAANDDVFPLEKTMPTKSCIKSTATYTRGEHPTPIYNATLRSECSSSSSLKQLHKSSVRSSAFQDACMLGAVWLRQRGLGTTLSAGGFGQFEWATLLSILMRDGVLPGRSVLSTGYSSYQQFKATLQFLSSSDLISSPMQVQSHSFKPTYTKSPMLFDGSRGLNILYKMSPWSYRMLRNEAQNSLEALNDPLADHFRILFINKVDEPSKRFDLIFRVPIENPGTECSRTDVAPDLAELIYQKFCYGLGDRATLVYPQIRGTSVWPLDSRTPPPDNLADISVGLLLHPEHCRRTVDRGPSVEDTIASANFRKFWGDKAELRRFKDGTILESLIWNTSDSKQAIIDLIISYVLGRHFSQFGQESSSAYSNAFDRLLPQQALSQPDMLGPFGAIMGSFGSLSKSIRAMEGLPLQIRQIFATSPELRYSSLYAPLAGKQNRPGKPVECLIQFEGSTRWPEDLLAVQRTKIAFLLKMADSIGKDASILAVRLRLQRSKRKLLEQSSLDIKTTDGMIFRLQIYHERELGMLEQALNGRVACSAPREEIALALSEHKRKFIQRPTHTQAVTTLSTRYPLLSLTIRLLKKWRDSHLLSSHLADELIELIAIRTFVCPYPWQPPGSLNSAFLRTLSFVAGWDWQSEPLIVDFNSELNKQDIQAINTRFDAWRKLDPGMNRVAMFAASNIDREGITWTDRRPAKIIAARFTNLARAACELVREQGLDLKPEALFVPSLGEYDIIIHLKKQGGDNLVKKSSFKNLQIESQGEEGDAFDALFNPQRLFFDELEELYGEDIVFFYNESAITVIAGLWNPHTGPRNWKVGLEYSTMPLAEKEGEEEQVTINKAAVLHDIARLGGDMITKIDQK